MPSLVSQVPAADSASAIRRFESAFSFETDCWDVHAALAHGPDFVLIDVRSPELFANAHVPGAINIPHAKIIAARMAGYAPGTLFVVYCAGPHCNGAERGAPAIEDASGGQHEHPGADGAQPGAPRQRPPQRGQERRRWLLRGVAPARNDDGVGGIEQSQRVAHPHLDAPGGPQRPALRGAHRELVPRHAQLRARQGE